MGKREHLYSDSKKLLKNIRLRRLLKPRQALEDEIRAQTILAMYYASKNDSRYYSELEKQIELELIRLDKYRDKLWPESQNDLTFIALAVDQINNATKICSIDTDYSQSHKFSVLLNCKLRKILRIPALIEEPQYKPIVSEKGLFQALDNIQSEKEVDWDLLKKYWKLTRSKRYEVTIFEGADLFSLALRNAEIAFNNRIN